MPCHSRLAADLVALACLLASSVLVYANTCSAMTAGTRAEPSTPQQWMNKERPTEERVGLLLEAMTLEEKLTLVFGYYSTDAPWKSFKKPADGVPQSAGYVPGVARLGIPALKETDAGIGVASQAGNHPTPATALPSGLALAATWDPDVAFAGGQMIGREARLRGFNVMLAGGINLARDPRGGRTFEYAGEDPWLSANIVAAEIRGVQSNHIISTMKHFAFNDQETHRNTLNVRIEEPAARMSDLLAFELAIERSQPGAVMCAYNRLNSVYSCEHAWLLNDVLKRDWSYKGFVMSDWGGTHSTIPAANAGLDQESGYPFDASPYFSDALKEAVIDDHITPAHLNDMVGRILRSMLATGLFDDPVRTGQIDFTADARIARTSAEEGIVLLKNEHHALPLSPRLRTIAIIGSHADVGVLSGGGSSQVYPPEGLAVLEAHVPHGPRAYQSSSPLKALATRTHARVSFNDGTDMSSAVATAAQSDVTLIFAHQWSAEGVDNTLRLDESQDELISAVAGAAPRVVVVLETGGPVLMPWLDQVDGVLQTWYPGSQGGEAIARVLTGEINPSGHLPLTYPRDPQQLPRPTLDGYPESPNTRITVDYRLEGAAVGYKWYAQQGIRPLFPFGYGLSYSRFTYSDFKVKVRDNHLSVQLKIHNQGSRAGKQLAQIYVAPVVPEVARLWQAPLRLGTFRTAYLQAGAEREVASDVDPRLLASYDPTTHAWVITEGDYKVILATDANTPVATTTIHLSSQHF